MWYVRNYKKLFICKGTKTKDFYYPFKFSSLFSYSAHNFFIYISSKEQLKKSEPELEFIETTIGQLRIHQIVQVCIVNNLELCIINV